MSYVKIGLGYDMSKFSKISAESLSRASGGDGRIATTESIAHATEEQAFVAGLKSCERDDGQPGWLYTNRYDVVTCTANPVGDRKNELRGALAIVPPLISNKVRWKDGKWIPIIPIAPARIDKNYLRLLLNALSNPAGEAAANKARISWQMEKDGQRYSASDRPMTAAEVETAVNIIHKEYSSGGKHYGRTKNAFVKVADRQKLRLQLGIRAVELSGTAAERAAPAEYAAAAAAAAAGQKKTLFLVAGGMVALVVVASLVKKRKRK